MRHYCDDQSYIHSLGRCNRVKRHINHIASEPIRQDGGEFFMSQLPIMSVSGIRGIVDETLTEHLCATTAFFQTKYCGGGKIIVGRDTRPDGKRLASAIFRGIRLAGGMPVDIGISPTPTTCFAVDHFSASGGVIITASHNPLPYNGYKMVSREGRLFSGAACDAIYEMIRSLPHPSWEDFLQHAPLPDETLDAAQAHVHAICAAVDAALIRQAGICVAVDAINGAASAIFPLLLEKLGVQWEGINDACNGDFVHNPEPRPEHLTALSALLRGSDAFWCGFAFDPDADRLATMGEKGQAISEEMTLALALSNVFEKEQGDTVTNLSTSMVIDDVAAHYGRSVHRTKIGEANVVEAIVERKCPIGGEGNGGVIYPRVSTVRDGLTAMALIIELMAQTGKRVSALTSQWRAYPIVKDRIALDQRSPGSIIDRLSEVFSDETIDCQDGLKIIRPYGWVHIRPSNTEPIMRCYAEAHTSEQARDLADMIMRKIRSQGA